jgi:flagellar biosynthetic protein FlhB
MADGSKTEQATPQRRRKAREQGNVARSRELPSLLAIVGVIAALMLLGQGAAQHWTGFYRELLDCASRQSMEPNSPVLFWSATEVLRWVLPVLSLGLLLSLAAQLAQGGFTIAPEALQIKPDRMNPASRLGQIFSVTGLSNLLKSLLPFGAIAWIGASTLSSNWVPIVHASTDTPRMLASFLGGVALTIGWKCGLVLLLWSGIEYLFTWHKMEGDLKMSKQDVKDEMKQTDGNPAIKARVRRVQRQMRRRHALKAAATATVVVTNPTHYAVALRYEQAMAAPIVVAKGLDLLAQQIKDLATEHGIPLMENRPLAQALYKSVEVGESIPSALYQAVADILVVVFRAQADVRAQEARRRARNASGELIQP